MHIFSLVPTQISSCLLSFTVGLLSRVPKADVSKARFLISAHIPINTPLPFLQLFSCQLVATSCFWYLRAKTLELFSIFSFFPTSCLHISYIAPINTQCTSKICPEYGHLSVTLLRLVPATTISPLVAAQPLLLL